MKHVEAVLSSPIWVPAIKADRQKTKKLKNIFLVIAQEEKWSEENFYSR